MKRVDAGAHLPTPRRFEPAKRQTIEPTTAWTAIPPLVHVPGTQFPRLKEKPDGPNDFQASFEHGT